MEEKKKNEELQSRREFFKKAAKGALPILAAVALASAPNIIRAAEYPSMGCSSFCTNSCYGRCMDNCTTLCQGSCKGTCDSTCQGTCKGSCQGSLHF